MEKNIAFIVAPLLTVVYGVVRLLDSIDGERGPGIAWTVGHLAFLGALGLFAVVVWEMRRRAGRGQFATGTAVVALVGIGCAVVQFGIDLVVGMLATDHAAMSPMFESVQSLPGVELAVYAIGPVLFYLGLIVAACHLVVVGELRAWSAAFVTLGVVVAAISLDLLPVAGLLMTAGLFPLTRRSARPMTLAS
ncbi:hypothetical protein ACFWB0_21650 [Rhodococcus sp. NPDC060086]|jgi:hypothetical protein|uniref:hypothetical protein n=1 Tax=Rhodococcus sp. NPDC060086 TaxID=3347055 RepID=UPI003656D0F3